MKEKIITVVGLPYYNARTLILTKKLVVGSILGIEHDEKNAHSTHAMEVSFNELKIGYVSGRVSEEVFKLYDQCLINKLEVADIRDSCLRVKMYYYEEAKDSSVDPGLRVKVMDEYGTVKLYYTGQETGAAEEVARAKYNKIFNKEETMFDKIVTNNANLAQSAAFLEAGRIANNTAAKFVASKAPLMVKGYVDTAVGKLIIANAAAVAVEKFRPTDRKLARLANAMITEAYQEVYRIVDIEKMLNEMLSSESVKAALSKLDVADAS